MSKDPNNPFAQLNARDFPSRNQRGNQPAPKVKGQGGRTVVKDKAAAKAEADAELDADAEMFMNALGGGLPLPASQGERPCQGPGEEEGQGGRAERSCSGPPRT